MNLKEFLKTKPVLANISLVIIFFIALSYLSLLFLNVYTHHGQSLVVPNFKGLSFKEASSLSRKKNLRAQLIDSIYIYGSTPGTVLEQYPSSGDKVKQKRIIYLTIASVTPELAPVPKAIDVSLREAQSRLETAGFKIGQVIYRPSEFINLVLEQRYENTILRTGTMLPKGTPIDLIVGKGLSSEFTSIPVLFGLSLDDARARLYELNLNTGVLIYDNTIISTYDSLSARIWKQSPDSFKASSVELGTSFDLWLTNDEAKLNPVTAEDTIVNIEEM